MTPRPAALVIEDAPDVRLLLCETLRQAGLEPAEAGTGTQGLDLAARLQPDLVTLDLLLPDIDGIEVCRRLRSMTNAYVIMLTALADEADRLVGLEVGADDYIVKPFSPRELRARVMAMFRRPRLRNPGSSADEPAVLRSGRLTIDRDLREAWLDETPVRLTRTEFDLLATFMARPRRVWERGTLTRQLWHTDWPGDDHAIDVHVSNLRRKLGDNAQDGQWLLTVRGVGYRFAAGVEAVDPRDDGLLIPPPDSGPDIA